MLAWCPSAKTIMGGTLTILISFGVMTFISALISNLGNKLQRKLFDLWGGAPTTLIIRHTDELLDKYTKVRYHQWLEGKMTDLKMPSLENETNDPKDADHKYRSATNFLREFTRDKNKFAVIYNDNVTYGFSRNLLSIRNFGLLVSTLSAVINAYFLWSLFENGTDGASDSVMNSLFLGAGAGVTAVLFMFAFAFVVNEDFVKERAFRYAKSLYEACEIK